MLPAIPTALGSLFGSVLFRFAFAAGSAGVPWPVLVCAPVGVALACAPVTALVVCAAEVDGEFADVAVVAVGSVLPEVEDELFPEVVPPLAV